MPSHFDLHRKRALALFSLFLATLGAPRLAGQVGLGLSPMRVDMRFGNNRQYSNTLTLSTSADARIRVRAELLDFSIDASETPQFARSLPAEREFSCREWLTVNPMEVELAPKGSVPVRFTFRIPPETAPGGYHCAVGLTTVPTSEQADGIGLRTAVRMVASFYAVVGDPAIDGGFREIRLESVPGVEPAAWRAVVVLANPGRTHFRPVGGLEVLDAQGQTVESVAFRSLPVLPQRDQRFLFPLKQLRPEERYTLRARMDVGTNEILEGTAEVEARVP